jgi:hypothetical protein
VDCLGHIDAFPHLRFVKAVMADTKHKAWDEDAALDLARE